MKNNKIATKIIRGAKSVIFISATSKGLINDIIPNTKRRLKIFEPMIFPTPISSSPFLIAVRVATNSGNEVPIATIVKPIASLLIPK